MPTQGFVETQESGVRGMDPATDATTLMRQRAQALIAAYVHESPDLQGLLHEATEEYPRDMLRCLAGFICTHTGRVDPQYAEVRQVLDYTVKAVLRALRSAAQGHGGDEHDFVRSYVLASSDQHDEHLQAAQALLAAAAAQQLTHLYEELLSTCAHGWGRVTEALIDIWITAALDALPACGAERLLLDMLESSFHVMKALASFAGPEVDEMLEGYWLALAEADAGA